MVLTRVFVVQRPKGIWIFGGYRTNQGKRVKIQVAGAIRADQIVAVVESLGPEAIGTAELAQVGGV